MTLFDWIGKDAVVDYDKKVPFKLLKKNKQRSIGDSENLIIEGDNLEALKSLLPHYYQRIKCIYIDPPYNTGNNHWSYNDNVNSATIQKWLGKVVDIEDLNRHDKWLCMMYPRLKILKELLCDDGVIFVSISDKAVQNTGELYNLKLIMDQIFYEKNFLANIIWQHSLQPKGYVDKFSVHHNHILCYRKTDLFKLQLMARTEKNNINYSNPDNDPNGKWRTGDVRNSEYRKNLIYDLKTPSGKIITPPDNGWRWEKKTMFEKIQSGEVNFNKDETRIMRKIYLKNVTGRAPETIWFGEDVGTTRTASQELKEIFGKSVFETPKPKELLKKIIKLSTGNNDIILDSFAGSGTTAHAVLELNEEENTNRKFILVELESDICQNITSYRVKKAIEGYVRKKINSDILYKKKLTITDLKKMNLLFEDINDIKLKNPNFEKFSLKLNNCVLTLTGENTNKKISKLKGGFQYAVIDKTLFNSNGMINEKCTFNELASYLYFTETKLILDTKKIRETLLDVKNEIEYHLIFKNIGNNKLDRKILNSFNSSNSKIIYADKCIVSDDFLQQHNTIFKQIPYEVKTF